MRFVTISDEVCLIKQKLDNSELMKAIYLNKTRQYMIRSI